MALRTAMAPSKAVVRPAPVLTPTSAALAHPSVEARRTPEPTRPRYAGGVPVSDQDVIRWMALLLREPDFRLGVSLRNIAGHIAYASNLDALVDGPRGPRLTAAMLTALGYTETARAGSRFHPNLVRGNAFGLFQIRAPSLETPANDFLLTHTACFIAIDLLRQGFEANADEPYFETRLCWYDEPKELTHERLKLVHRLISLHERSPSL